MEIAQTRSPRLVEGRPSVRVCAPVRDERDFDACASTARGMRRAAGWGMVYTHTYRGQCDASENNQKEAYHSFIPKTNTTQK